MWLRSIAGLVFCGMLLGDFVPQWNRPIAPYRVISNLYYVGTNFLASFLIATPQGHILVNPDYEQSVPIIRRNVEKLGFHFSDIKIILISHAHDDHAAGCALAKKLSGAKLMVMDGDVAEIESGGGHDFQYHQHWTPVKVDRILQDGDKVTLDNVTLVAHLTPGHTKGCTTWTTEINQNGRIYHVVIVGSPNVNPGYKLIGNTQYPQIADDYEKTFRVLASLPCDIFLGAHGVYYDMDNKLKRLRAGGPNPFVDPDGYRAYVHEREQAFRAALSLQQHSPSTYRKSRQLNGQHGTNPVTLEGPNGIAPRRIG
jgi:metallo-beta-lactamase class B